MIHSWNSVPAVILGWLYNIPGSDDCIIYGAASELNILEPDLSSAAIASPAGLRRSRESRVLRKKRWLCLKTCSKVWFQSCIGRHKYSAIQKGWQWTKTGWLFTKHRKNCECCPGHYLIVLITPQCHNSNLNRCLCSHCSHCSQCLLVSTSVYLIVLITPQCYSSKLNRCLCSHCSQCLLVSTSVY